MDQVGSEAAWPEPLARVAGRSIGGPQVAFRQAEPVASLTGWT
jgi:hypothetical protein